MLPGETIASGASPFCTGDDPDDTSPYAIHHAPYTLVNEVCDSNAGYYVGTFCPYCGPYSRESGYYPTHEAAQAALTEGTYYRYTLGRYAR